jgi:3-carboxy-cis,cis-muconate cycloisomerase
VSSEEGLFSGLFARGEAARAAGERAFLEAMLAFEVALMNALAHAGLAPHTAADELVHVASQAADLDLAPLGAGAGEQGTPVPALLRALRARLSDEAAAYLHRGATSQDVIDSAGMLVARRALQPIMADLHGATEACATLASAHRDTLATGRTLLQHALPVTLGLKAAGWLVGLEEATRELVRVDREVLALQFGGAVGTLAALGAHGLEIAGELAEQLGLVEPPLPWHTIRLRPAALAAALAAATGVMGKLARDVVLLAQTEVAEVAEGGGEGRGGSSTMPHKRNPVAAVAVLACAQRTPGLLATIYGAMVQEHERAAGAWQAEWPAMLELLTLTGSAASHTRELLAGLRVDAAKLRADLNLTSGLLMSEAVATALSSSLGRAAAQQVVERAARDGRPFRDALLAEAGVESALGPDGVDAALDPAGYLGATARLIDRALSLHRARAPARATD